MCSNVDEERKLGPNTVYFSNYDFANGHMEFPPNSGSKLTWDDKFIDYTKPKVQDMFGTEEVQMHAGNAYGITLTLPGEGNTNTALPWIIAAGKPGIQTTNGQWVTIFALGGTNYTINTLIL